MGALSDNAPRKRPRKTWSSGAEVVRTVRAKKRKKRDEYYASSRGRGMGVAGTGTVSSPGTVST